jgi:hypothetical protein
MVALEMLLKEVLLLALAERVRLRERKRSATDDTRGSSE